MMLASPTLKPRSLLFLEHLGPERQRKLLAGEEFLLVYLDIPALRYLLSRHGFDLTLRNMKADDQIYADDMLKRMFGQNKVPDVSTTINGEKRSWTILSGTW